MMWQSPKKLESRLPTLRPKEDPQLCQADEFDPKASDQPIFSSLRVSATRKEVVAGWARSQ